MENWSRKRVSYAKKVIKKGMNSPFYKMTAWETPTGVNLSLEDKDGNYPYLSSRSGYYCIYRNVNDKLECLYVGKTESNFQNRIHRWAKGIAGNLRHDENHPAATKARRDGVKLTDKILVKVIDWSDIREVVDDEEVLYSCDLDEWIAPILKSKYNVMTCEECGSLEDFL